MEHVVFNGIDLSERFVALVTERPMPASDIKTEHISGSDRYALLGVDVLPEPISVRLVAPDASRHRRRELARWLGDALYVREPAKLELSDEDGLYRMAVVTGRPNLTELVASGYVDVKFQPMHAALYGVEHSVTVPSGGSATFLVTGTYPTEPTISASAAIRSSSSNVWGVRLDETDFLHVATGTAGGTPVVLNCEDRTCLVNDLVAVPTLDSDWFVMESGSHTISNDQGTGACTVTWTDRWL